MTFNNTLQNKDLEKREITIDKPGQYFVLSDPYSAFFHETSYNVSFNQSGLVLDGTLLPDHTLGSLSTFSLDNNISFFGVQIDVKQNYYETYKNITAKYVEAATTMLTANIGFT